jgi:hypothetical protein
MKVLKVFMMALTALALVACGKGGDDTSNNSNAALASSALVKTWVHSASGDQFRINQDGSVSSLICGQQGSITSISPDQSCPSPGVTCGTAVLTITSSNGSGGCQGAGTATCAYITWGNNLTFNCGGSSLTYQAQ